MKLKNGLKNKSYIHNDTCEYTNNYNPIISSYGVVIGDYSFNYILDGVLEFNLNIDPKYKKSSLIKHLAIGFNDVKLKELERASKNNKIITSAIKRSYITKILEMVGFRRILKNISPKIDYYIYNDQKL